MTCVLLSQMILLGFSSGNALAFGRYCLFASGSDIADGWEARGIAIACITFAVVLHSTLPKWGIRLFNVLGVFKVFILLFIVCAGFAALAGHRKVPNPRNFDNAFRLEEGEGYGGGGAYAYAGALLRIIYTYVRTPSRIGAPQTDSLIERMGERKLCSWRGKESSKDPPDCGTHSHRWRYHSICPGECRIFRCHP